MTCRRPGRGLRQVPAGGPSPPGPSPLRPTQFLSHESLRVTPATVTVTRGSESLFRDGHVRVNMTHVHSFPFAPSSFHFHALLLHRSPAGSPGPGPTRDRASDSDGPGRSRPGPRPGPGRRRHRRAWRRTGNFRAKLHQYFKFTKT